jgi:hypothetical protein
MGGAKRKNGRVKYKASEDSRVARSQVEIPILWALKATNSNIRRHFHTGGKATPFLHDSNDGLGLLQGLPYTPIVLSIWSVSFSPTFSSNFSIQSLIQSSDDVKFCVYASLWLVSVWLVRKFWKITKAI